jgi:hypothetical protein
MGMTFTSFRDDDTGAVTVDWVVLSAAVIGLGMIVLVPIAYSTDSTASGVADNISNIAVGFENN